MGLCTASVTNQRRSMANRDLHDAAPMIERVSNSPFVFSVYFSERVNYVRAAN